eukprot:4230122-Prymnesium_polylepis.1
MPCWGCGEAISSGVGITYFGRILHAARPDCQRAADEREARTSARGGVGGRARGMGQLASAGERMLTRERILTV